MTEGEPPKELIKYYVCNEYSYDALINNYLWAADPLTFNDPFDCSFNTWDESTFTSERIRNYIGNYQPDNDGFSERDKMIRVLLAKTGIVCLNNPDEKYTELFWGYYSNQEGFSIKFDRDILSSKFPLNSIEAIKYLPSLKVFELPVSKEELAINIVNWAKQKKDIWQPENEWRYLFFDIDYKNIESRKKYYNRKSIKHLTLGLKFFPQENSFLCDPKHLIFTADSKFHCTQSKVLSFLDTNSNIEVFHMFFRNDLNLHLRRCIVKRKDERLFEIEYQE